MEWVHGAMQKDSFHTLNKKSHVYSLTYLSIFVQDAQKGDKSCSSSCLFSCPSVDRGLNVKSNT